MTFAAKASVAALFLLAGCQSYVDGQGRTHLSTGPLVRQPVPSPSGPGEAYVPDAAIVAGVRSFVEFNRRDGLATLRTMANGCRKSAARGTNGDLIPQCFAMDVATYMITVSHDRVHHAAPAPDMDVASFHRRFALYQQALAVPPALHQQVEDSVIQRVGVVLGGALS